MVIGLLILILSGITTAALGLVVYLRNPKSAMSRSFLLFSISTVVWASANFMVDAVSNLQASLIATRLTMAAGFNAVFWLYVFSQNFNPRLKAKYLNKYLLAGCWLLGTVFSASYLVAENVVQGQGIVNVTFGPFYPVYIGMMLTVILATFWQLRRIAKQGSALERTQVRLIVWGIALSVGVLALINVLGPFFISDLYLLRISPIFTLSLTGFISYAVIKHSLFDIRFVVARSVAYLLVLLVMGGVYSVVVFTLLNRLFDESAIGLSQQLAYMFVALVLAFTFQPLKRFFDRLTDRIFYRDRYSLEELVTGVTSMAASTLDLTSLSEKTLAQLSEGMHVDKASLWVIDDQDFYCSASYNLTASEIDKYDGESLLDLMSSHQLGLVLIEQLSVQAQRRLFMKLGVEIAVPLVAGKSLQGVLLLGSKRSGELYTGQDINALKILGPSLAISLENARSYKQISEFNQTLEKEVEKATHELTVTNDKLSRSNDKLRQLDSLKDEFISITSHELRTPLTAIRGYLWMAMHGRMRDKKTREGYLERAYISTERLIALVNDSLDISRIDSGRVQLVPAPTDIVTMASEVVTDLRPRAIQQEQTLRVKRVKGALPSVMVDPEKLYQVLTNLIGNALKFTPSKGVIEISFVLDGAKVITTISDTGPGISQEDQGRLFQKFSRLDASATTPGTGLGLFLCREIIHMSKGKIWVESEIGKGSAFKFSLPTTKQKAVETKEKVQHAQRVVLNNGQTGG